MGNSSDKHSRQKANRQAGDALRQQHETAQRRRKLGIGVAGIALVAIAIAAIVILTGNKDEKASKDNKAVPGDQSTASTSSTSTVAPVELPSPPAGTALTSATTCPSADGEAERVQSFAGPPPTCIEDGQSYSATFDTTEGSFTAVLDSKAAPIAMNNFVVLSRFRFFEGVPFHRIIPGFVIQVGDGDGPPWGNNDLGYSFEDELPKASEDYTDYSLAMANSGPNTNGSQFFVVLPGGGAQLQPLYTRFGEVTEGRDVVDKIGALGDAQQQPTKVVLINSVKITSTAN